MHDNILPILTSFAMVLLLLAGYTQWGARNLGTLLNVGWLIAGNLIFLVNALVWRDTYDDIAPVWCDISVKLQVGLQTGLSAASLCINRRLAAIASSKSINTSQRSKRNNLIIDLICGFGFPIIVMSVNYVIQARRYLLFEGYGCENYSHTSLLSIFLYLLWPLAISTVSAVYGGIAIYYFVSKRLEFRSLLKTSNSGLDTGHFIRLLCLASMDIAVAVPLSIYLICINSVDLQPYNWTEVHRDWNEILQVPSSVWMSDSRETMGMSLFRYIPSVLAFALFALIGMTEDSIGRYMKFGAKIRKFLPGGRRPLSPKLEPVSLGSTATRVDGSGLELARFKSSAHDDYFNEAYDSPTSPRFKDSSRRIGISVERQVV